MAAALPMRMSWTSTLAAQVDRLGEALARYYEAPDREAGQSGIYWRPFTGTVRIEDLDAMTPEQRAYVRAKGCLPKEVRQVVERRIVEWTRWVKDPTEIPGYACEPDPATAGYLCNYPSVAGELAQLRRSCDDAYDPNWAAEPSKQGAAGFPDTSGGEDELPPTVGVSARACCSRTLETPTPTPTPTKPAPTTPAAGAPPTRIGARETRPTGLRAHRRPHLHARMRVGLPRGLRVQPHRQRRARPHLRVRRRPARPVSAV